MSDYELELNKIRQWLMERDAAYDADTKKRMADHTLERDSEAGYQNQLDHLEYRRKVRALKSKYGIDPKDESR
ncbi:hypothetical protein [Allofournierella sp.]|uniref:hypothetical protein n=1 Tax=Allofournierella sp. TaxID=1940256 RepID=UPI003AF1D2A2